jgi:adenylyltransferase/sulfurtransferase
MLTPDELVRYQRQLSLFGEDAQSRLKQARVLVAGAGGLGSPIIVYLAVAGVGKLRIVDHDTVNLNNLNRQILHWDEDIGRSKLESASRKLAGLNHGVEVETISATIDDSSAVTVTAECDAIMDAMDNYPARYALNRAALTRRIPFFHGAVHGFYGQATTVIPGRTACLRCVFPQVSAAPPPPVVGATCGIIGCIQVTELLKYISGKGQLLENRLLMWDGLNAQSEELPVNRNPECPDCRDVEAVK